eukprot:3954331-Pleurochrysis_carterae.AAC.2
MSLNEVGALPRAEVLPNPMASPRCLREHRICCRCRASCAAAGAVQQSRSRVREAARAHRPSVLN